MALKATGMVVAAFCLLLGSSGAGGAERLWDGGGANDNWSTAANWDGDAAPPASGDALLFDTVLRLTPNNDLVADSIFGPITFGPNAGSFVIGGNRITLGGNILSSANAAQAINPPLLLNDNRTLTVDGQPLTLGGVISGQNLGITKTGTGTLVLGAANTYTGPTVLDGGTVAYSVDNSAGPIVFGPTPTATSAGTNVSTLDLINANLTTSALTVQTNTGTAANVITIGAGKTLTVNGAFTLGIDQVYTNANPGANTVLNVTGNSVVVNGGTNHFTAGVARANTGGGADPISTLDMSGLTHFSYTGTTGEFTVGGGNNRNTMSLANTSNTITAGQVRVGDTAVRGASINNNGGRSILRFGGGTNVINSNTIILGETKGSALLEFQGAGGTLTIAGQAGGTSAANIQVGSASNATGSNDESVVMLDGHDVTIHGGNVVIGRQAGTATGGNPRGTIAFDTGTFNANSLQLGVNSAGTATNGATGTFILGGPGAGSAATGVLNVASQFYLANRTNTAAASGPARGTFTINGGTANVNTDIIDASTTVSTAGPNLTTLNLDGGTLNITGHNIGSRAAPITNVNLNSGTLNDVRLIAGQNITLGPAVTITGIPTYFVGDGGTFNAPSPALTLVSGGGLEGGGAGAAQISGDIVAGTGSRVAPGRDTSAGSMLFFHNLTLNNGSTARFKLSENPGGGNDQITVLGNLTLNGTVNLDIGALGAGAQAGNTYTLFNYSGTLTGNETNFATGGLKTRSTYAVVPTGSTPGSIQLSVGGTPAVPLTWVGNVDNNWDLDATANWKDANGAAQRFFNLDPVTFDDSSTNMNPVQLVGQLVPGGVTVSANRDYKFAGSGGISGTVGLTKDLAGTLIIANENTYGGATNINNGTVQIGDGGTAGSIGSGVVNNNGTLAFNRSNALTFANEIHGGGAVTKDGTGTLTLRAVNTYSGPTNIRAGTLVVTNNASLGAIAGGDVFISSGAALDLVGNAGTNNADFGTKLFRIAGTGANGTGALTNSGTVGQQNAFEEVLLTDNASVGGTGRFDIRGDDSTLDLAGFTLTKVGTNQFTLVSTDVTSGNIVVNGGRFAIETTSNVADIGGTITYNASTIPGDVTRAQFFNLTGTVTRPMIFNGDGIEIGNASAANQPSTVGSNITLNGNVIVTNLNNSAGALTLNGIIGETGGPRSITKNGPTALTLGGANTYSGETAVNGGTLSVTGSIANSAVVVNNAATFEAPVTQRVRALTVNNGGTAVMTPGPGKVLTVGDNTTATPLNVSGGRLEIADNGLVVDYSPGSEAAALNGVRTQIIAGYNASAPGAGDGNWQGNGIISSAAAANPNTLGIGYGHASDVIGPGGGTFFGVDVDGTSVVARHTILGDADLSGGVGFADLVRLAQNYNSGGASWAQGDFTYDGNVGFADLVKLAQNYNSALPAALPEMFSADFRQDLAAAFAQVPEPSALAAAAAMLGLLAGRRRR